MADGFDSYYFQNMDLQGDAVWTVNVRREGRSSDHDSSPKLIRKSNNNLSSSRVIPIRTSSTTSKGIHHHHHHKQQQSSAPVDIPDWSRIYRNTSKKASWMDHDQDDDHFVVYHDAAVDQNGDDDDDVEEEEEEEEEMVPPHEFIARKLSRTQISSFSMCEGAGRTLKGRDLSKVRNAVLTKTGFLEQK